MLKIFSNESEVIINLVDVEVMNDEMWENKLMNEFNDEEKDIICDLCFEGNIVKEEDNVEFCEYKEMSFKEYVNELKDFCKECLS